MERAQHALIDPLIEPDPSDETGLNTHFRSTFAPQEPITPPGAEAISKKQPTVSVHHTGSSVETNPYRRSRASSDAKNPFGDHHVTGSPSRRRYDYPSPPNSASPRREHFSSTNHRSQALGSLNDTRPRRSSNPAPVQPRSGRPARSGSLRERYPGDMSHRPLDALRKDEKTAHRAPHLRKKNFPGADVIDRLDAAGFARYHHEGPYDAASIARNKHIKYAPIEAVRESNEEALRATPRENIADAVSKHRPLEGVANIPPGMPDRFGRVLNYEEGADLQREPGGDYRRWPGQEYHPDDLKGKGEPSYTIEKALKEHKALGDSGTEMKTRHRHSKSVGHDQASGLLSPEPANAEASGIGRSNTTGKGVGSSLKKRFGSIRRRKQEAEA
ncbi:hypothetical protein HBH98_206780 [Parastagonospora nodorum]|nr:hypothetical protein HBH53_104890 [Parastagonospora nodorum]KAH4162977.1 hypothetical protein HBH43_159040 [Parastagonospora nodorum]KAH4197422.1 hypothetical protein HBH42_056870 [Parastagonospora nodorum]KAH4200846.1 hypothetical protein HBI95_168060 [Parastagonospora nodorum]KAH4339283.1 hypothetical protein HBH98_206780 [Parastagonospora nodorum]